MYCRLLRKNATNFRRTEQKPNLNYEGQPGVKKGLLQGLVIFFFFKLCRIQKTNNIQALQQFEYNFLFHMQQIYFNLAQEYPTKDFCIYISVRQLKLDHMVKLLKFNLSIQDQSGCRRYWKTQAMLFWSCVANSFKQCK